MILSELSEKQLEIMGEMVVLSLANLAATAERHDNKDGDELRALTGWFIANGTKYQVQISFTPKEGAWMREDEAETVRITNVTTLEVGGEA